MFGFTRVVRSGSGGAFPDEMQLPPVVRIRLQPAPKPPRGFDLGYKRETAESILELNLSALLNSMSKEKKQRFEEEAKQIAFDRNIGRISQWAQGQRDNIDRPKIGHIHRKRAENEQLILDYRSHYGASQLDVIVKYDTWVQLLMESGLDDVCLFVFHSGNTISAFPMKNFEDNRFSQIAKYVQKGSVWGDEKAKATQLRVSPTRSVLLSEIKYDEKADPKFSRTNNYSIAAVGAGRDLGDVDGCRYFEETSISTSDPPIMNGEGTTVYMPEARATINDFRMMPSETKLSISPGKVFGVSKEGRRYYGFRVTSAYESYVTFLVTAYDEDGTETSDPAVGDSSVWYEDKAESDYAFLDPASQQKISDRIDELYDENPADPYDGDNDVDYWMLSFGTFGVDGNADWDYTYALSGDDREHIGDMVKGDQNTDGVIITYNNGSYGVDYRIERHSVTVETYDRTDDYTGKVRISWSFAGEFGEANEDGRDFKAEQIIWPPALNGNPMFKKDDMFYTDWGVFGKFKSWCFITNGDYTLVGLEADGDRVLYRDTARFSEIAPFINGDIQCVWMDVPLRRLFGD